MAQTAQPLHDRETSQSKTVHPDIDSSYTPVPKAHADNLGELIDNFLDRTYPLNRDDDELQEGEITTNSYWRAIQRPDGSGVVESSAGTRTFGIRTAGGIVVGDGSGLWFPYKSDYHLRREDDSGEVRHYDEYDWFARVPFEFIERVVDRFTDLGVDGGEFMRSVTTADILDHETERGILMEHRSGVQLYVGYDSTGRAADGIFGFCPFDGTSGVRAPSARDALDLLMPNEAAVADGVSRQGEVFLVPTEEDASGTIQKPGLDSKEWGYNVRTVGIQPTRHDAIGVVMNELGWYNRHSIEPTRAYLVGSPLDSHIPREWRTMVDDDTFVHRFVRYLDGSIPVDNSWTPQDVVDYVWENEHKFPDTVYHDLRSMADGIQVRGSLRHRRNEHPMVTSDSWRMATTHDWDVVTIDQDEDVHLDC